MTVQEIVARFNTTPFLFVGSGMTRRYFHLPDWKGLLEHFANEVRNDPFAYNAYESKAKSMLCPVGILPKVATLIQQDYDEKWFLNQVPRTVEEDILKEIKEGLSPFKAEIATFIAKNYTLKKEYQAEIDTLTKISKKSIAGVITTNYDTFLEDHFQGFKKYIGQSQLIFSAIQGIAEIYKIHGSIEQPASIVINEEDYQEFDSQSAYLASKLMTIFMEYPIIFIGYSISDSNIQNILKSIVGCLNAEQLKHLESRFVFVEYDKDTQSEQVSSHTIMIEGKPLAMSKITLSNFLPLYEAIGTKQSKLPVRILRQFKQELYSFVITNTPTATLRVAPIDDSRVSDEDLVLAVGRADQLGIRGLNGINGNDWYRNIVLGDLLFTADELLEHAFPVLIGQNSNRLPVNKYLSQAKGTYPECVELSKHLTLNEIIPDSILKRRGSGTYHSIKEIWEHEKEKLERATRLISQLSEDELSVTELEMVLQELFEDRDYLEHISSTDRSQVRRLILIYDFLKWGPKEKEPSD